METVRGQFNAEQQIKRANEKGKKTRATSKGYRTSKSRNLYAMGLCYKRHACQHFDLCERGQVIGKGYCAKFSLYKKKRVNHGKEKTKKTT